MRRTIIVLALTLASIATMHAQDLTGRWSIDRNQMGMKIEMALDFQSDAKLRLEVNGIVDNSEIGFIDCRSNIEAIWAVADSVLTARLDPESLQVKMERLELAPAIANFVGDPSDPNSQFSQMTRGAIKSALDREFGDREQGLNLRIVSVTEKELTLRNERSGRTLKFQRK